MFAIIPTAGRVTRVLVVDMSGSMRRDDVNGARCRSDGVWMALARDFVKEQLEKLDRHDDNVDAQLVVDVVSVVLMIRDGAEVILKAEPMDWMLYNRFIDYREWSLIKPSGHGFNIPALEKAEELLELSRNIGSCSLSLVFFSDGKPSDVVVGGRPFYRQEKENKGPRHFATRGSNRGQVWTSLDGALCWHGGNGRKCCTTTYGR